MQRVGVKYCGHCNPQGDGLELLGAIEKLAPDLEFFSWGGDGGGVLLIYSACQVACVSIPVFDGPVLHVVGATVNGKTWPTEELPGAIVKALRELLEKGNPTTGPRALGAASRAARRARPQRKENHTSWKKSL